MMEYQNQFEDMKNSFSPELFEVLHNRFEVFQNLFEVFHKRFEVFPDDFEVLHKCFEELN